MGRTAAKTNVYLIGVATNGAQPHFVDAQRAEKLLECVRELRDKQVFAQHSYVLLPEAYYAILTPNGSITKVITLLKRATSECLSNDALWAPGELRQRIPDVDEMLLYAGRLHLMPVTQGLIEDPEEYPYSSLSSLDADPILSTSFDGYACSETKENRTSA